MTTTTTTEASPSVSLSRLVGFGVAGALVAVGVNVLVRLLALTLFDVPSGFGPLEWMPIVNTTIVAVAGATVVYGLLIGTVARPTRAFAILAAIVLVVSFVPLLAPPEFLADAPRSVLVTLGVMHVTTAAVAVGLLPQASKTEV